MTTIQARKCIDCGSTETYMYKGHPRWHTPRDRRQGFQCHSCYSSGRTGASIIRKRSIIPQDKPVTVAHGLPYTPPPSPIKHVEIRKAAKPTLAEKIAETRLAVARAETADALQKVCKSFTNFYEAEMRSKK